MITKKEKKRRGNPCLGGHIVIELQIDRPSFLSVLFPSDLDKYIVFRDMRSVMVVVEGGGTNLCEKSAH